MESIDTHGLRFHTVVLLIDRIKLDQQVGDSVENFLRRNGMDCVFRATSIDHLAALLAPSSLSQESKSARPQQRVIITTIQKMVLLAKNEVLLTRLLHGSVHTSPVGGEDNFKRIAIITDEAHRSNSFQTREMINAVVQASERDRRANVTVRF